MENKISYKLITYIFLISIAITSISTYIHIKEQYKNRLLRFEKSLDSIKENQIPVLTEALWRVDYKTVDIFLNTLTHSEGIIYVQIIENGKVTRSIGEKKISNTIEKNFEIIKQVNSEIYNIGKLTILADLDPLYKDLQNNVKGIVLTEVIKMLLLSILIVFLMKKLLTNPLEKIAIYANKISLKNLQTPLEIEKKEKEKYNELDIVSNSINTMRLNLLNQIEEKENLQNKYYQQLQEKIDERDHEIEERKKVENDILLLNETLEVKVYKRTRELKLRSMELEDSLKELKKTQENLIESEKMAGLGQLVAGVAHEINTPVGLSLTGITHFLSLSENLTNKYKNDELSQEEFEEFINISNELAKSININLEKTAQLVKSFKQVSVDQSSDEKRMFKIKEYLEEILLSIKNITKKTQIKINIDCDEEIETNTYAGAISQIITNLILNSLRHAYNKDSEGTIDIIIKEENENIIILFKDYGKGISKENLPKIFNPFFTTNREEGGSGLGLSIIYNLVTTKLKGTITCESKENKGTTFKIVFNRNIR